MRDIDKLTPELFSDFADLQRPVTKEIGDPKPLWVPKGFKQLCTSTGLQQTFRHGALEVVGYGTEMPLPILAPLDCSVNERALPLSIAYSGFI